MEKNLNLGEIKSWKKSQIIQKMLYVIQIKLIGKKKKWLLTDDSTEFVLILFCIVFVLGSKTQVELKKVLK